MTIVLDGTSGITSPNETTGVLTATSINASSAITAASVTTTGATGSLNSINTFGFKNRIINGGMQVAQRSSTTLTGSYQFGQCDRWQFISAGGTGVSGNIVQNQYVAYTSGYSGGVMTASWTNGQFYAKQLIEAKNVADFGGKTITVSVRVYQDTGGTRGFAITLIKATSGVDNWLTQAAIGTSSTFNVATTSPTLITASFTLGASDNINGIGVVIYDTAPNTVASKAYLIGDAQIELGSTATSFDQRAYSQELAMCQRYYESGNNYFCYGGGGIGAVTDVKVSVYYKVTKRISPSVLTALTTGAPVVVGGISANGLDSALIYYTTGNSNNFSASWTVSSEL